MSRQLFGCAHAPSSVTCYDIVTHPAKPPPNRRKQTARRVTRGLCPHIHQPLLPVVATTTPTLSRVQHTQFVNL